MYLLPLENLNKLIHSIQSFCLIKSNIMVLKAHLVSFEFVALDMQ